MNTIRLTEAPNSLGSWDRMVTAARAQNAANAAYEGELQARKDQFCEDFDRLLSAGNLRAHVFFARKRSLVKAPSVHEVLWDAISESPELQQRMVSLLFFASESCDVREYAKELRQLVIKQAAEDEVEE